MTDESTPTQGDPGTWTITVPSGPMVCGYCGEKEWWDDPERVPAEARQDFGRIAPRLALGYLGLTGEWSLAVAPDGALVVVAFATTLTGDEVPLPHHCTKIPDSEREKYAADVAAILDARKES